MDRFEIKLDEDQGPDHLVYPLNFGRKIGAAAGDFCQAVPSEPTRLEESGEEIALIISEKVDDQLNKLSDSLCLIVQPSRHPLW